MTTAQAILGATLALFHTGAALADKYGIDEPRDGGGDVSFVTILCAIAAVGAACAFPKLALVLANAAIIFATLAQWIR